MGEGTINPIPATTLSLEAEVADRFIAILTHGDSSLGVSGLATNPQFISHGSGMTGDPDDIAYAVVLLQDDFPSGTPAVLVRECYRSGERELYGWEELMHPMTVVLDCSTSEFEGAITDGVEALGSEELLAYAVEKILSNDELMAQYAFNNVRVMPGALLRMGLEYKHPLTVLFEAYQLK